MAASELCGINTSAEVIFNTNFIEAQPVNTCVDETKAAILTDSKVVAKLDIATSDLVHPIWLETDNDYSVVLKDIDNYLAGNNDAKLQTMFEKLMSTTVRQILSLNPQENKDEFGRLVELFRLQLQLFYNILGCQSADIIKEFGETIQFMLDLIIKLLQMLKDKQVVLPATLQEFMKNYAERVKSIDLLSKHVTTIKSQNLI